MVTVRLRFGKADQGECNSSRDERLHRTKE